jgi:phage FluMu protein Com
MRSRPGARGASRAAPPEAATARDCRCSCGNLLARLLPGGVELKCRRCKRVLMLRRELRLGREDVAHQHARVREDRRAEHALEQAEQRRVMLEGVIRLEAIDPAENLEVARLRIDAESARVGHGVGERRVRPEPSRVSRDRGHLSLDVGDRAGRQETGKMKIPVLGHPRGQRGTVSGRARRSSRGRARRRSARRTLPGGRSPVNRVPAPKAGPAAIPAGRSIGAQREPRARRCMASR